MLMHPIEVEPDRWCKTPGKPSSKEKRVGAQVALPGGPRHGIVQNSQQALLQREESDVGV